MLLLQTKTSTIITLLLLVGGPNNSLSSQIWISKAIPITRESLDVQALVVKDEEVAVGCKATNHNDIRYSSKRYLMCAGSILTSRYILTSASCIHEATHIRHNIRAPLAVMIAPFSDTAQVIKIAGYSVHPGHLVDPRDEHHALHNVAIAKLVCRIFKSNLHEIKLPTQPFVDQCAEYTCKVTITKEIGPMSFTMYEVAAEDISVVRAKRELLAVSKIKELNTTANEGRFNDHDIKKVLKSNEKARDDALIIKTAHRANNESSKYIDEGRSETKINVFKRSSIFHHNSNRKLVTRESHGIKGCPQTGSAVMSNAIQSAMVTVSCDDRQPETPWQYTDLFDNLDWINEMIGNWKPSGPTLTGCTTCIYNFFIDYNCKNRAQCQKNLQQPIAGSHSHIPDQLKHECSKNHTDLKNPFAHNHTKIETTESVNQAYFDAIYNLYLNKHDHSDDNDNDSEKNSYFKLDETAKSTRLFSQSASPDFNATVLEKTLVPDYKGNQADNLDPNYRKVKATYDNDYKARGQTTTAAVADGNEHPQRKNRDYEARYNRIKKPDGATTGKSVESLQGLFASSNGEESLIPKEFAELYKKFLAEHKQAQEKVEKNVVRRG